MDKKLLLLKSGSNIFCINIQQNIIITKDIPVIITNTTLIDDLYLAQTLISNKIYHHSLFDNTYYSDDNRFGKVEFLLNSVSYEELDPSIHIYNEK